MKRNKKLSYVEYWTAKGQYGLERIKRMQERLEKKRNRLKHHGGPCKHTLTRSMHACPFYEEMYSNYSVHCRCCSDCQHDCAMDV